MGALVEVLAYERSAAGVALPIPLRLSPPPGAGGTCRELPAPAPVAGGGLSREQAAETQPNLFFVAAIAHSADAGADVFALVSRDFEASAAMERAPSRMQPLPESKLLNVQRLTVPPFEAGPAGSRAASRLERVRASAMPGAPVVDSAGWSGVFFRDMLSQPLLRAVPPALRPAPLVAAGYAGLPGRRLAALFIVDGLASFACATVETSVAAAQQQLACRSLWHRIATRSVSAAVLTAGAEVAAATVLGARCSLELASPMLYRSTAAVVAAALLGLSAWSIAINTKAGGNALQQAGIVWGAAIAIHFGALWPLLVLCAGIAGVPPQPPGARPPPAHAHGAALPATPLFESAPTTPAPLPAWLNVSASHSEENGTSGGGSAWGESGTIRTERLSPPPARQPQSRWFPVKPAEHAESRSAAAHWGPAGDPRQAAAPGGQERAGSPAASPAAPGEAGGANAFEVGAAGGGQRSGPALEQLAGVDGNPFEAPAEGVNPFEAPAGGGNPFEAPAEGGNPFEVPHLMGVMGRH